MAANRNLDRLGYSTCDQYNIQKDEEEWEESDKASSSNTEIFREMDRPDDGKRILRGDMGNVENKAAVLDGLSSQIKRRAIDKVDHDEKENIVNEEESLSDYERMRMDKIRRNQARLKELGLVGGVLKQVRGLSNRKVNRPTQKERQEKPKSIRRSGRKSTRTVKFSPALNTKRMKRLQEPEAKKQAKKNAPLPSRNYYLRDNTSQQHVSGIYFQGQHHRVKNNIYSKPLPPKHMAYQQKYEQFYLAQIHLSSLQLSQPKSNFMNSWTQTRYNHHYIGSNSRNKASSSSSADRLSSMSIAALNVTHHFR